MRSIYTSLKVKEKPRSTQNDHYGWIYDHDQLKSIRVDRVNSAQTIQTAQLNQQPRRTNQAAHRSDAAKLKSGAPPKAPNKESDYTIQRKKLLLRGNGNITGFFDPVDGKVSSYQTCYKGQANSAQMQARPIELDLYASGAVTVSPDPYLLSSAKKREQQATERLERIAARKNLSRIDSAIARRRPF